MRLMSSSEKVCRKCGSADLFPTGKCRACYVPREISPRLKEQQAAARRRWREANPDKDKASKKAWALRNAEQVKITKEAWRKANLWRFNEAGKAWKRANPEAMRIYQFRLYGLTVADYDRMMAEQGGCCAICSKPPSGKRSRLCVDHCHSSNEVRGLLCTKCNAGLGSFNDDPGTILAAERYIQASSRKKLKVV